MGSINLPNSHKLVELEEKIGSVPNLLVVLECTHP
jgi:hypothetical protein